MPLTIRFGIPTRNLTLVLAKFLSDDEMKLTTDDLTDEDIELTIEVDADILGEYLSALPQLLENVTTFIGGLEGIGQEAATARSAASGNFRDLIRDQAARDASDTGVHTDLRDIADRYRDDRRARAVDEDRERRNGTDTEASDSLGDVENSNG
jgi:hypothetical protein